MLNQLPLELVYQIFETLEISKVYNLRYLSKNYNIIISNYLDYYWTKEMKRRNHKKTYEPLKYYIIPEIEYRYADGIIFYVDKDFYNSYPKEMLRVVAQYARILSISSLESKEYVKSRDLQTNKIIKENINRLLLNAFYNSFNHNKIYVSKEHSTDKFRRKTIVSSASFGEGSDDPIHGSKNDNMGVRFVGFNSEGDIGANIPNISTKIKQVVSGSYQNSSLNIRKRITNKNNIYNVTFGKLLKKFNHASYNWSESESYTVNLNMSNEIVKETMNSMKLYVFHTKTNIKIKDRIIKHKLNQLFSEKNFFKDYVGFYAEYKLIDQL